jgi:hypothetical protein
MMIYSVLMCYNILIIILPYCQFLVTLAYKWSTLCEVAYLQYGLHSSTAERALSTLHCPATYSLHGTSGVYCHIHIYHKMILFFCEYFHNMLTKTMLIWLQRSCGVKTDLCMHHWYIYKTKTKNWQWRWLMIDVLIYNIRTL